MGGPNGTHPGRVVEYDQPPSPRTPSRRSSAAARKELGRRLAKDFENLVETLATFVTLVCIQLALRRLARA